MPSEPSLQNSRLLASEPSRLDVVDECLAAADVGDIERLAVGRADDAVGLAKIVGHAGERLAIGRKIIGGLLILFGPPASNTAA